MEFFFQTDRSFNMSKAPKPKAPCLQHQGYADASLTDILHATGLQKGGLYNHFDSKEDLAVVVFDWSVNQLSLRWREATKAKTHAIDYLLRCGGYTIPGWWCKAGAQF